jgi:hypothetical protein
MNQAVTMGIRPAASPAVADNQDGDDSVNNMAPTAFERLMA